VLPRKSGPRLSVTRGLRDTFCFLVLLGLVVGFGFVFVFVVILVVVSESRRGGMMTMGVDGRLRLLCLSACFRMSAIAGRGTQVATSDLSPTRLQPRGHAMLTSQHRCMPCCAVKPSMPADPGAVTLGGEGCGTLAEGTLQQPSPLSCTKGTALWQRTMPATAQSTSRTRQEIVPRVERPWHPTIRGEEMASNWREQAAGVKQLWCKLLGELNEAEREWEHSVKGSWSW
jgi:hypothetical protein